MQAVQQDQEALALASEAEELSQVLEGLKQATIQTPEQAEELNELVKEVKRDLKQLEVDCTSTTRPTFERLEAMRDWFRPKRTALKELERVAKLKLAEFAARVQQAQQAAQAAAGQAFARGDAHGGHAALAAIPETPAFAGTSIREEWTFEVFAPDMVPYQLCSPDPEKIKAYLVSSNGGHVPGLRIFKKPIVTTRV
jgi:hypothetical protein